MAINLHQATAPRYLEIKRAMKTLEQPEGPALRVAVAGYSTLTPFAESLATILRLMGVAVELYEVGFGQWPAEGLDPNSELHVFAPDVLFVLPDALSCLDGQGQPDLLLDTMLQGVERMVAGKVGAVIIGDFSPMRGGAALQATIARLNGRLGDWVSDQSKVYRSDMMGEAAMSGMAPVDWRLYYYGQYAFSPDFQTHLAWRMSGYCLDYVGMRAKVLVTDLDNTVWRGVLGEDGLDGIEVGVSNAARPYRDVQLVLKLFQRQGMLLAICSKNDEALALKAIEGHPGMILRRSDFAAWRINWQNKADNLKALAAELELGLDRFVFIDDQPAERMLVREQLPEVWVPELPSDVTAWPRLIEQLNYCRPLWVSEEDRKRSAYYQSRKQANELRDASVDMVDYLRRLEMQVVIRRVSDESLTRVAQLVMKTNQFNLTTRRHSRAELEEMMSADDYEITALQVTDAFGDQGIVGVCIVRYSGNVAVLDSFLLSCRVIGRHLEHVMFDDGVRRSLARGCSRMEAVYIETERNHQVANLLENWGFCQEGDYQVLDLSKYQQVADEAVCSSIESDRQVV